MSGFVFVFLLSIRGITSNNLYKERDLIYGDKSLPKTVGNIGKRGRTYYRTNIEHYITKYEFDTLREERKSLKDICELISFPSNERQFHKLLQKFDWDVGEKTYGKSKSFSINENFFKTWSRDTAWVYGWLLTDGSVDSKSGQTRLMLKTIDRDVLVKIKQLLEFTGKVYDGEQKDGRKYSYLRICRKNIAEDLFSLGMARKNKTFNTVLPSVPDDVFWDLVRGIIEGDGGIQHKTGNTDALNITITGATKQFMLDLQTELEQRGVLTRIYTRQANSSSGNKSEMYTLNTKSNADALRICYFMYANTTEKTRLNRKYNIFSNYINTYYDKVKRRSIECNELVELSRQRLAS